MRTSALERLLTTERVRRRATPQGFALPIMQEVAVNPDDGPFVVTTSRGDLVRTRTRMDQTIWAAFHECLPEEEDQLLRQLYLQLVAISKENGWANRCTTLTEAIPLMGALGYEPVSLVVPVSLLEEACGEKVTVEEAETLMAAQGYVALMGDIQVLAAGLLDGTAILTTGLSLTGTYARADDCLAVAAFRADRAWVLVGDGVA